MRTRLRLLPLVLWLAGAPSPVAAAPPSPPAAGDAWKEVDRLVGERKLASAIDALGPLLASARARHQDDDVARALLTRTRLRMQLGAWETAARELHDEPWPESFVPRLAVELYYAQALLAYLQRFAWQIRTRERVDGGGPLDLTLWTTDQIVAEAERAYQDAWSHRAALGDIPVAAFGAYLEPNDYPMGIRDTLRDALTYLVVDLLGDTALWTPAESSERFRLDARALATSALAGVRVDDTGRHPLERVCAALADLEAWHASQGGAKLGGALEARLVRLRVLREHADGEPQREALRAVLEAELPRYRGVAWWSTGAELDAEWIAQAHDRPRARLAAVAARDAWPDSYGSKRAIAMLAELDQPELTVDGMASDGARRRSLRVRHRNVAHAWFRAYAVDVTQSIVHPDPELADKLVHDARPVAAWDLALPATVDLQAHQTFVTPPLDKHGRYLIAISRTRDFLDAESHVQVLDFLVSDLAFTSTTGPGGVEKLTLVDAATGAPVAGATVDVYQRDWHETKLVGQRQSDARGDVAAPDAVDQVILLLAHRGDDVALHGGDRERPRWTEPDAEQTFLYTDRGIYRPGQTIHWKVVAFHGNRAQAKYEVLAGRAITVKLVDGNQREVARVEVKTNAHGSASGSFVAAAGRLLGRWTIDDSLGGTSAIRVEEYRRPTFEVTLVDPKAALRLNQPASLDGEARYYFGLPVTSGSVRWRVERQPLFADGWSWARGGRAQAQTVDAGVATVDAEGHFAIRFTPIADEALARTTRGRAVSYRFAVHADLVDAGGETRSAERSYRVGFVSVEATLSSELGFFRAGAPVALDVRHASLDGVARAGHGAWRLVTIAPAQGMTLPAETPPEEPPDEPPHAFHTPGDGLRARWEPGDSPDAAMAGWRDVAERAHGELDVGSDGKATLSLGALPPGAWRVRYTTRDDFGAPVEVTRDLVVAAPPGARTPLPLPLFLGLERASVPVGETARLLVVSGIDDQPLYLDRFRDGELVERRLLSSRSAGVVEIPIREADRGGFAYRLWMVRDHQAIALAERVLVPWDDRELAVEIGTLREPLRPGAHETLRVTVRVPQGPGTDPSSLGAGGSRRTPARPVEADVAELLAYLVDRSLDALAPHPLPSLERLYPTHAEGGGLNTSLGSAWARSLRRADWMPHLPSVPRLRDDELAWFRRDGGFWYGRNRRQRWQPIQLDAPRSFTRYGYGIRERAPTVDVASTQVQTLVTNELVQNVPVANTGEGQVIGPRNGFDVGDVQRLAPSSPVAAPGYAAAVAARPTAVEVRENFAETALWAPHLLTGKDGSATIELTVPDSVTSWSLWVQALTRELHGGSAHRDVASAKELMVRPYLPRFLREGDRAALKVVVNNASDGELSGTVDIDIRDAVTQRSLADSFELKASQQRFTVKAHQSSDLTFAVVAPRRVGLASFRVTARAGNVSDGELRPVPVLPSRVRLAQSRFVTLRGPGARTMKFADMSAADATRVDDQLVVTVDGQLFYTVLRALPYLVDCPYETTDTLLHRFVSAGIVSALYARHPAVAAIARQLASRKTRLAPFAAPDANRRIAFEETPWLAASEGGDTSAPLVDLLDPDVAHAQRDDAIARLSRAQTADGGFPWFPGGPSNPHQTLYVLSGIARAAEDHVDVPRPLVQRALRYLRARFLDSRDGELSDLPEMVLFNYVSSSFPATEAPGSMIGKTERDRMADVCFLHWKELSPRLKGMLALTLHRMGRERDARLVWDSVMDAAKTLPDQGTFWAPEEHAWLWYEDTTETEAFALRTLLELRPDDARRHGLVLWLLLDKQLNHWKSTRATVEVLYALMAYLEKEGGLDERDAATVTVGDRRSTIAFAADKYVGKTQIAIAGADLDRRKDGVITVAQQGKGTMFASATWHFSTEKLPAAESGDFFAVSRRYFRRDTRGKEVVLVPLSDGVALRPGDEIEVHLSLRARHAAEYVHLRDPRAAGLEPEASLSRYRYQAGVGYYEETRDSGANFFFDRIPDGEFTFQYRLRAHLAGTFRALPATVQSLYAPEFHAYSAGDALTIH